MRVATDAAGNVYVSGYTHGAALWHAGAGQSRLLLGQVRCLRQFPVGEARRDKRARPGWGVATDGAGNIYIAGETGGPLNGNTYPGALDVFITKYNPAGTQAVDRTIRHHRRRFGPRHRGGHEWHCLCRQATLAATLTGGKPGPIRTVCDEIRPGNDCYPSPPIAKPGTGATSNAFTANWNVANGALGYRLDISTSAGFSDYVSGYQDLDVGNVTNRQVTGLTPQATYHYRVRAYNTNGTSGNSETVSVTLAPANPCTTLLNADFEGGFSAGGGGAVGNNWTEWEATPGVTTGYDESAVVHGGHTLSSCAFRARALPRAASINDCRSSVATPYTVSVWIYAGDDQSACYLGVDPAGGTNEPVPE